MSDKTLEQKRAEYSYRVVEIIANDASNTIPKDKFKTLVKKAPTLILTNGFGNFIAYLFSKGKNEHLALAYIIGRYLFKENSYTKDIFGEEEIFYVRDSNKRDFFDYIIALNELNKIQKDYNEDKNQEKKNELKEKFNSKLENLKNYDRYLNDELKARNISKFKMNDYIQYLSSRIRDPIFQNLVFTETDKYILATEETLRLLNWLRRFVEAMIEYKKEENQEVENV